MELDELFDRVTNLVFAHGLPATISEWDRIKKKLKADQRAAINSDTDAVQHSVGLLDYFAAKAMQSLILKESRDIAPDDIAGRAYYYAAVMLQERKRAQNIKGDNKCGE